MATNYLGTVRCMQAALPSMRARRSGCIRAHATPPADIATTIVRVARDESSPFRVATGQAAAETIALRRELTDAAWRDVLGRSELRRDVPTPARRPEGSRRPASTPELISRWSRRGVA